MSEVCGIGNRIVEKPHALGIRIYAKPTQNKLGSSTLLELQETSCSELDDMSTPKQNIMTSRSFG